MTVEDAVAANGGALGGDNFRFLLSAGGRLGRTGISVVAKISGSSSSHSLHSASILMTGQCTKGTSNVTFTELLEVFAILLPLL